MSKKNFNHAACVLKEIKSEVMGGVIKDYEMPTLCSMETGKEKGFLVILTLSKKFDYRSEVLDNWRKRLEADEYMISVRGNQLRIKFFVRYN